MYEFLALWLPLNWHLFLYLNSLQVDILFCSFWHNSKHHNILPAVLVHPNLSKLGKPSMVNKTSIPLPWRGWTALVNSPKSRESIHIDKWYRTCFSGIGWINFIKMARNPRYTPKNIKPTIRDGFLWKTPNFLFFLMTDTQSSIQQGTSWVHQKEIRGKRLLLNFTKVISTSKAVLFLSLQTTHISASGATLQVLHLLLLPYFKLNINPFTMPGITQ